MCLYTSAYISYDYHPCHTHKDIAVNNIHMLRQACAYHTHTHIRDIRARYFYHIIFGERMTTTTCLRDIDSVNKMLNLLA